MNKGTRVGVLIGCGSAGGQTTAEQARINKIAYLKKQKKGGTNGTDSIRSSSSLDHSGRLYAKQ